MKLETTIKKIEETLELLEVFGTKRKPLILSKVQVMDSDGWMHVHVIVGYDEIGKYIVQDLHSDIYFKDVDIVEAGMWNEEQNYFFRVPLKKKNDGNRVLFNNLNHLKRINKYFKLSKPSKKALETLKYKNKSFVLIDGKVVDVTTPEARWGELDENVNEYTLPRKEDLLRQKVYLHGKEPTTNVMLMSRDFTILPKDMNKIVIENLCMSPHLIDEFSVDYYEEVFNVNNPLAPIGARGSKDQSNPFQYYTIQEPLYISLMTTLPKSSSIIIGGTRSKVKMEYIDAFINMKRDMTDNGVHPNEVRDIMLGRKVLTGHLKNRLKQAIGFRGHVFMIFERALFKNIDFILGLDSISFGSGNDRNQLSKVLQENLEWVESSLMGLMQKLTERLIHPSNYIGIMNIFVNDMKVTSRARPPYDAFLDELLNSKDSKQRIKDMSFHDPYKELKTPSSVVYDTKVGVEGLYF